MTHPLTRRAALGLLASAAGAALPLVRTAPAAAQLLAPPPGPLPIPGAPPAGGALDGLRISRVVVNASALRSPYSGVEADLVTRDLTADLKTVFADRMAAPGGRGVTLLARVDSLFLPPWAGGRQGGGGGDGPDNIQGVGVVLSGNRVLSQTPLYTTLAPSYSGPWYLPNIDQLRIQSICYQFAYWLRREMSV